MLYLLVSICILTLMIILFFVLKIYKTVKNNIILSDVEKEFIEFTIDMYIKYAIELNIYDEEKHEIIVNQLKEIVKKIKK